MATPAIPISKKITHTFQYAQNGFIKFSHEKTCYTVKRCVIIEKKKIKSKIRNVDIKLIGQRNIFLFNQLAWKARYNYISHIENHHVEVVDTDKEICIKIFDSHI